eukprot:2502765-Prymnesium_polylepis.1
MCVDGLRGRSTRTHEHGTRAGDARTTGLTNMSSCRVGRELAVGHASTNIGYNASKFDTVLARA